MGELADIVKKIIGKETDSPVEKLNTIPKMQQSKSSFKVKKCIVCGREMIGGSVCSDKCFYILEKR